METGGHTGLPVFHCSFAAYIKVYGAGEEDEKSPRAFVLKEGCISYNFTKAIASGVWDGREKEW